MSEQEKTAEMPLPLGHQFVPCPTQTVHRCPFGTDTCHHRNALGFYDCAGMSEAHHRLRPSDPPRCTTPGLTYRDAFFCPHEPRCHSEPASPEPPQSEVSADRDAAVLVDSVVDLMLHDDKAAAKKLLRAYWDARDLAARKNKDQAYEERNKLVAYLTKLFPSGIRKTNIEGWSPDWHGCVYIDTPEGQLSWHYHDSQAYLFAHLPVYEKPYDSHTTSEKYERLARLTEKQTNQSARKDERERIATAIRVAAATWKMNESSYAMERGTFELDRWADKIERGDL